MINNAQLIFAIQKDHPHLVHGVDFWVGQPVDGNTYTEESKLYAWYPADIPEPDHQTLIARATALLPEYEASHAVPQVVTATQGGIALIQAGHMGVVQAAANDPTTPADVKWAWDRAQTWERASPALNYLADKANITARQMDDLFIAAAQIQA